VRVWVRTFTRRGARANGVAAQRREVDLIPEIIERAPQPGAVRRVGESDFPGHTYGHPNPWALRYDGARGRPVFRTDLHGDVWISAARDGSFVVETEFTYPGDTLPRTFAAEVRR
jgi:hypothetical protein